MKASLVILACIVVVAVLGEEQVVPTTETFQHGGYIFKFNVEKKVLVDTPLYQQGVASVNVQAENVKTGEVVQAPPPPPPAPPKPGPQSHNIPTPEWMHNSCGKNEVFTHSFSLHTYVPNFDPTWRITVVGHIFGAGWGERSFIFSLATADSQRRHDFNSKGKGYIWGVDYSVDGTITLFSGAYNWGSCGGRCGECTGRIGPTVIHYHP